MSFYLFLNKSQIPRILVQKPFNNFSDNFRLNFFFQKPEILIA
jgi:hypothetical protein